MIKNMGDAVELAARLYAARYAVMGAAEISDTELGWEATRALRAAMLFMQVLADEGVH